MFFKKTRQLTIDVQFGGYYVSLDKDNIYQLWRLLDLNPKGYDIQLFNERYTNKPSFAEVQNLKPYILHAPIDLRGLFEISDITLLGHKPLTDADMEGYLEYLKATELNDQKAHDLIQNLVAVSNQPVIRVVFEKNGSVVRALRGGDA